MSDVLLIVGLIVLAAAGFLLTLAAGLAVVGAGLIVLALAFADNNRVRR